MVNSLFSLWRQRIGYGIADLSCNLVWQLISLYLMYFYTDVMALPAYYVGLMFLVTRLVDGVADVLMGLVIDNTSTRWGRCRPWLLIGAIPFGILCILVFYVPDFGTTGKLIYAFITYLCLSFIYTLVNIPFSAMLPFLTADSLERTTLSSVRILLGSLGSTIVAVATLPLVATLGNGDQTHGFLYTAIVFGIIATFFLIVSFKNVEEKITIQQERMTLTRAWKGLKTTTHGKSLQLTSFLCGAHSFYKLAP
nr:glycoside-pentoside-hexuronide (GPH):cation symporter [Gilliamella sp. ESL0443]